MARDTIHQPLLIKRLGIIAFGIMQGNLSHCQIWQACLQESICSIASASETNLELQDGLAINDVTRQAYSILRKNRLICAAY